MHHRLKSGFTLIELIVVLAIIGILFSVIAISLTSARAKARDAKRMTDMGEYRKALALYNNDNGRYPISATEITLTSSDILSTTLENAGLISEAPIDPIHPAQVYTYITDASGTRYTISFCLETNSIQGYAIGCGHTIQP